MMNWQRPAFVSVTVDWRHDSPAKLRNYTADFGYDWPHLTGAKEYLDPIYENYGVYPYEEGDDSEEGYTVAHPSPTYILDTEGKEELFGLTMTSQQTCFWKISEQ